MYNYILGESGPSESGPGPPGPSPTGANLTKQPPDSGGPSIAPTPPQNIDKSGIVSRRRCDLIIEQPSS